VRDYLRPDEVDAMVQAARKSGRHRVRDAAIILMLFRHGLRTAELVALRWQQVDLKAGYLDVHRVKRGHDAKHPLDMSINNLIKLRMSAEWCNSTLHENLPWII
jgi:integrase